MEWAPIQIGKVLHKVCCVTVSQWIISGLADLCTAGLVIGNWN